MNIEIKMLISTYLKNNILNNMVSIDDKKIVENEINKLKTIFFKDIKEINGVLFNFGGTSDIYRISKFDNDYYVGLLNKSRHFFRPISEYADDAEILLI